MCASCGCGELFEDHADDRNITLDDLERAAKAAGVGVYDVVQNIREAANGNVPAEEEAAVAEE